MRTSMPPADAVVAPSTARAVPPKNFVNFAIIRSVSFCFVTVYEHSLKDQEINANLTLRKQKERPNGPLLIQSDLGQIRM